MITSDEEKDGLSTKYLLDKGVQTLIHYPIPIHHQKAYSNFKYLELPITELIHKKIVSLPLSAVHTEEELNHIINALNEYN